MLDRPELTRRIKAARELRGVSQDELAERLAQEGLGKHDLGRLERGESSVVLTPVRRYALAHALRVPERWFTDESVDAIVAYDGDPPSIEAHLASLTELLLEAHHERQLASGETVARVAAVLTRIDALEATMRDLLQPPRRRRA